MRPMRVLFVMISLTWIKCNSIPSKNVPSDIRYYSDIAQEFPDLFKSFNVLKADSDSCRYVSVLNADICTCNYSRVDSILVTIERLNNNILVFGKDKNNYLSQYFAKSKLLKIKLYLDSSSVLSKFGFLYPDQILYKEVDGQYIVVKIF